MKTAIHRRIRRHPASREAASFNMDKQQEQSFFGESSHDPFFKPANGFTSQPVAQLKASGLVNESVQINREKDKKVQQKSEEEKDKVQKKAQNPEEEDKMNTDASEEKKLMAHDLTHVLQQNSENKPGRNTNPEEAEKERVSVPTFFERGIIEQNTRHNANCSGVNVEGHTDANYGNSYTARGASTPVSDCPDCSSDECVENRGAVISVFTTNPQITLPPVPSGLNECEQNAVQRFINTTLNAHEREHVAAFNTYRGRVRTPYTYRGCASGLDDYLQQLHDRIEAARKANSDAASAALDAGGANIFTVNCDCPDPESDSSDE